MSKCAEAIKALVKPKVVKPKIPKDSSCKLNHFAFIAHPKLGKWIRSYMAKGCRLCQPKPKVQTKAEASAPAQAPKVPQAPMQGYLKTANRVTHEVLECARLTGSVAAVESSTGTTMTSPMYLLSSKWYILMNAGKKSVAVLCTEELQGGFQRPQLHHDAHMGKRCGLSHPASAALLSIKITVIITIIMVPSQSSPSSFAIITIITTIMTIISIISIITINTTMAITIINIITIIINSIINTFTMNTTTITISIIIITIGINIITTSSTSIMN
ncbi:hypothetical protein A6R68_12375 [Neotoma lepida]|uniref:Uncharacterized protein n=1 Tax=Neotoma lepida TaxID=56216 RepID=A0A1A6H644_NEOLE|nr:hypothetical protein A6R68_12375 [Neotoma lepida]